MAAIRQLLLRILDRSGRIGGPTLAAMAVSAQGMTIFHT